MIDDGDGPGSDPRPRRTYAGPDRRATGTPTPGWRSTASLVVVLGVGLGPVVARSTPQPVLELLPDARVAALALTLLLTLSVQIHWKATGQALGAHVAAAGWTSLAGVTAPLVAPAVAGSAGPAATAVALATLSLALTGPDVEPRVRPWRTISTGLLAFVALTTLLTVAAARPALLDAVLWPLLGSAWWAALAATAHRRARTSTSALLPWLVPFAAAAALSDATSAFAPLAPGAAVVAMALHLAALLIGTYAAITALADAAIAQRLEVTVTRATADADRQARDAAERERAHDVRTAILAIEGATATLRQHRDHLGSTQRDVLDAAIVEGLRHLRGVATAPLFDPPITDGPGADTSTCDLAATVRTRVTLLCADGSNVRFDVARQPVVVRGEVTRIARVVDNLLQNALVHGRRDGRPPVIVVRVDRDGATGILRIEDDGPGIAPELRERVFEVGRTTGSGEGLGLHSARRLARQHGGEVTLSDSVLGGVSAQLRLPLAGATGAALTSPARTPTDVRTYLREDGIEMRQFTAGAVEGPYSSSPN